MASEEKMKEYLEATETVLRVQEGMMVMLDMILDRDESLKVEADIEAHLRSFVKTEILPVIVKAATKLIGSQFSDDEIDEIVTFHLSPIGQKLNSIMIPNMQTLNMEVSPIIEAKGKEFFNGLFSSDESTGGRVE